MCLGEVLGTSLKTAEAFDEWLLQKKVCGRYVEELNHLQVVKRKRALTDEEANLELLISNDKELEAVSRLAACVLLDEEIRAKSLWNELDPETQVSFKTWPIARFFKPILEKAQ